MVTAHNLFLFILLQTKSPRHAVRTRNITDATNGNDSNNWYWWWTPILKGIQKLPVTDSVVPWQNTSEAQRNLEHYFQIDFRSPDWDLYNRHSMRVAAMTLAGRCMHLAKFGIGAHLVHDVTNGFQIDLTYMYKYEVRPGLLPYGCLVRYTYAFMVVSIEVQTDTGKRVFAVGEKDFIMAYNIYCSSLLTHTFLVDNVLFCHRFAAQKMHTLIATHGADLNEHFRRFVSIFLVDTSAIARDIDTILMAPGGIASRLFAFTPNALCMYLLDAQERFSYVKMYRSLTQNSRTPFFDDARAYNVSVNIFVDNILDAMQKDSKTLLTSAAFDNDMMDAYPSSIDSNETPEDILKFVIARHIFTVTFWKEHVGNYLWYAPRPGIIKTKIPVTQSHNMNDTKENIMLSALWACVSTRKNLPRVSDEFEMCMKKYIPHCVSWRHAVKKIDYQCQRMGAANYVTSV